MWSEPGWAELESSPISSKKKWSEVREGWSIDFFDFSASRIFILRGMLKNAFWTGVMNKTILTDCAFFHRDFAPGALPVREFGFWVWRRWFGWGCFHNGILVKPNCACQCTRAKLGDSFVFITLRPKKLILNDEFFKKNPLVFTWSIITKNGKSFYWTTFGSIN